MGRSGFTICFDFYNVDLSDLTNPETCVKATASAKFIGEVPVLNSAVSKSWTDVHGATKDCTGKPVCSSLRKCLRGLRLAV